MCELIEEYVNKKVAIAVKEVSIRTAIEIFRQVGIPDTEIAQKIQLKYGLTKTETENYLIEK